MKKFLMAMMTPVVGLTFALGPFVQAEEKMTAPATPAEASAPMEKKEPEKKEEGKKHEKKAHKKKAEKK